MKKILFVLLTMMPLCGMAQNYQEDGGKYDVYCDVKEYISISVTINNENFKIVDKDDNDVKTKEITEVLNLLSKRGWRLVDISVVRGTGQYDDRHYIMKKEIISDIENTIGLKKIEKKKRK